MLLLSAMQWLLYLHVAFTFFPVVSLIKVACKMRKASRDYAARWMPSVAVNGDNLIWGF